MKKRDAVSKAKNFKLRGVFLILIPMVLCLGAWQVRQLQLPIDIEIPSPGLQRNPEDGSLGLKPQKIPVFHQLAVRLVAESRKHPFAASISVAQITLGPNKPDWVLASESLILDRQKRTLQYSTASHGWTYSHVEDSGLEILKNATLENLPITLPPSTHAKLRNCGWTLTEHYLP